VIVGDRHRAEILVPSGIDRRNETSAHDKSAADVARGDYAVELFSRGTTPRKVRTARVEHWPRNAKPAWRLVQAAMLALDDRA
jgi:hypothetical protein